MKNEDFFGAFEEPHVIGTRIEIDKKSVAVLWRGGVVLKTPYKAEEADGGVRFVLKNKGLRYEGSATDYASVKDLFFKDGELTYVQQFPITGESRTVLKPTGNSRYGNYDEAEPEVYKELSGRWIDERGCNDLKIKGRTLEFFGTKIKFRLLRPRGGGAYKITDEDPSKDGLYGIGYAEYSPQGIIKITIPVCDAQPECIFLKKEL
ncbi:MAG: hypothetical protein IJS65_06285 [Clostridia bacterium]|nr:hypothetical protein [Clostridia bacterium]